MGFWSSLLKYGGKAVSKRFSKMRGEFPNWSFDDVSDPNARQKLINIANRFVAIYRKGQ